MRSWGMPFPIVPKGAKDERVFRGWEVELLGWFSGSAREGAEKWRFMVMDLRRRSQRTSTLSAIRDRPGGGQVQEEICLGPSHLWL